MCEIERRAKGQVARANPATAADVEAFRLAKAIERATTKIAKDERASDPIVRSAAVQLRALLLAQPQNATTFIRDMRANLARTDVASVGRKHTVLVKIYERMDKIWTAAQHQPAKA